LRDLVIHVDEEGEIDRYGWQPRVMWLAAHDRDRAPETLARDPSCEACEIVRNNILSINVTIASGGQACETIEGAIEAVLILVR
jgi:hypothetical protein